MLKKADLSGIYLVTTFVFYKNTCAYCLCNLRYMLQKLLAGIPILFQYVFNLAKYDKDYDLRDRARFMRAFVFPPPGHEDNPIIKHAKKIFLAQKPAPVTESRFKDRDMYQVWSLTQFYYAGFSPSRISIKVSRSVFFGP